MDIKKLHILQNPVNGESFEIVEEAGGRFLVGKESGMRFPVRDGIPVFIDPSQLTSASEKSRRYYDLLAPVYQFTQSFYYRLHGGEEKARKEYLEFVPVKEGDAVLEISVGNGANIRFLPRNAEYFGLDVSWGQLKTCRKAGAKYGFSAELFQAEAEQLPFHDNSFDVVFNVASINYFEDKKKAVDEMFRVGRPGARMMIADETEKAARAHNRLPVFRGFFNASKEPVRPPMDLLPSDTTDVNLVEIRNGLYYCLLFRKATQSSPERRTTIL